MQPIRLPEQDHRRRRPTGACGAGVHLKSSVCWLQGGASRAGSPRRNCAGDSQRTGVADGNRAATAPSAATIWSAWSAPRLEDGGDGVSSGSGRKAPLYHEGRVFQLPTASFQFHSLWVGPGSWAFGISWAVGSWPWGVDYSALRALMGEMAAARPAGRMAATNAASASDPAAAASAA